MDWVPVSVSVSVWVSGLVCVSVSVSVSVLVSGSVWVSVSGLGSGLVSVSGSVKDGIMLLSPKDKFLPATEILDQWGLNVIVYGPPGVGKTTFASTAADSPRGRDVLLIDVDGGARSIAHRGDVTVAPVSDGGRGWLDVREYVKYVTDEDHPYRTIVVDNLSELQAYLVEHLAKGKTADQRTWGESNRLLASMARRLRSLSKQRGINVVLTAHEREIRDEITGARMIQPALTPGAAASLVGILDTVGRLYLGEKDHRKRHLRLQPARGIRAKHRQPPNVPPLPDVVDDPNLGAILDILVRND